MKESNANQGGLLSFYKQAGVDVDAGDALVDWLSEDFPTPHKSQIVSGIGGFASLFRLNTQNYKKPCLVTCTDGVGTKVLLASEFNRYESVAQDMVAMCVNDLITTGADPLLFLDYYATSKLDLNAAKEFLTGVKKACFESDCALVGGETAEMPGVYRGKDFDCAGFAVGIVDEEKTLGAHLVQEGDIAIGVSSNGFHSNGYSLIRKVFEKDIKNWIDILLRPTHLYVKLAQTIRTMEVHALAHITGGGMQNIPRVIPAGLCLEMKSWKLPPEFAELQKRTKMSDRELMDTLNCGMGLVVVAKPNAQAALVQEIEKMGFKSFDLGKIVTGQNVTGQNKLIYPKGFL